MALTPDQEKQLNDHLLSGFVPPPVGPSSYDVDTQGPNLDSTLKMAGTATPPPARIAPPVHESHGASGSWEPATPDVAAKPDTAVDDEEETKTNPKVASSHPGFSPDDLDRYLLNEKNDMDKFGADKQASDFDALRAKQHSVGNQVGRGLAAMGDGIMQGVAQQGNPNFLEHMDQNQARQLATQTEANKDFNTANMAGIKAKEGLDRQSSSNALGASAAEAMIPMLKQIYPGKSDAEYAQMAHNPAVAEALLPEGVKLADAKAKLEEARSNREFTHQMQKDSFEYRKGHDYDTRLEKDTGGFNKDPNVVKAQGTLDKLKVATDLLESANPANINNNRVAKNMLQTALTFVATGGQRVNEIEMKAAGGPQVVTNKINMWIQNLDKGALTPLDYRDMKDVIGMYTRAAHANLSDARERFATQRAQREHIDISKARQELGGDTAPTGNPGQPAITPDVQAYAQKHGITPEQALQIKMQRTGGR